MCERAGGHAQGSIAQYLGVSELPTQPGASTFDVTTDLSQFLKPDDVDRFQIQAGLDTANPAHSLIFQIQLEFLVDEGNSERLLSDPLIISLPDEIPLIDARRTQGSNDPLAQCLEGNAADEKFMLGLQGRRVPDLEALTKQVVP